MFLLTLYFKSGNKIEVSCKKFKFERRSSTFEFCSYEIENCTPTVSFQPSELEVYTAKNID
ncbi:hypothetical protein NVP1214O_12 [Vibrio phage 1.214.O._10N.222.54.F11]|nr:hypothetical protein NVP1214O_12 [Vibrio phage 1.214.O._10N.222.54.F11]